jgi:hypothetical protein
MKNRPPENPAGGLLKWQTSRLRGGIPTAEAGVQFLYFCGICQQVQQRIDVFFLRLSLLYNSQFLQPASSVEINAVLFKRICIGRPF